MSIWCSLPAIGFDDQAALGEIESLGGPAGADASVGQVRSYSTGWSNHYPSTDGAVEREATLDLAYIPAWCAGGRDDDYESAGEWLRLGLRSHEHNFQTPNEVVGIAEAVVVMDEDAVRALVVELTQWLERPKVTPASED